MRLIFLCSLWVAMGAPATAPASFYNMRAKLVEAARRERFDGAAPRLTLAEQRCNATLMRMKQRLRKASPFLPALPFADARAQIGRTSLYRALSAMPKGAVLHLHWDSAVAVRWTVAACVEHPRCFMRIADGTIRIIPAAMKPPGSEWTPVSALRKSFPGGGAAFDASLEANLTVTPRAFDPAGDPWVPFQRYFNAVEGVLTYIPVYKRYLQKLFGDIALPAGGNVQYVELRAGFDGFFDDHGKTYAALEVARLAEAAAAAAAANATDPQRRQHPFAGASFIVSAFRHGNLTAVRGALRETLQLRAALPGSIAGFDLVGQEDPGYALRHFAPALLGAQQEAREVYNMSLPFYFHAGETSWGGPGAPACSDGEVNAAQNVFDAALLSNRIGHGLALAKYPSLMRAIASVGDRTQTRAGADTSTDAAAGGDELAITTRAVECCPISNQELGYVQDMRDHPAAVMMAAGVPLTISPDDPAVLGYSSVTHDWWLAFVSWEIDLVGLKQLAVNSIEHSALDSVRRIQLYNTWERLWNDWVRTGCSDD